jgi:hypothetical protein
LDSKNTIFAFSAVFGSADVTWIDEFSMCIEVINDIGQRIYYEQRDMPAIVFGSDHVWLKVNVPHHSQLETKTDNLRVIFKCCNDDSSQPNFFFRSCGFHLQHTHIDEEVAINDDIQIVETP